LPYRRHGVEPVLAPAAGATLLGTPLVRLGADDLAAEIEPAERALASDGRNAWLALRIRNAADRRWPAVGVARERLVGVELRARRRGDASWVPLPGFGRLPADLAPGEAAWVQVRLQPPRDAGEWQILPCLVQWPDGPRRCFESAA